MNLNKRFLCFLFALLLTHNDTSTDKDIYYTAIILINRQVYEDYFYGSSLDAILKDFKSNSQIESIFISKGLHVHESDLYR